MKNYQKEEGHPFFIGIIAAGFFGGLGMTVLFALRTFITIDAIFNWFAVFGSVVFLAHLPFRKRLNRYLAELAIYSYIGWGLILTALLLTVNYFGHGKPVTDKYGLPKYIALQVMATSEPVEINVTDSAYHDFGYLLKFDRDEIKHEGMVTQAWITTANGLFGYRVIVQKELH